MWKKIAALLDFFVTNGMDDRFTRAEREYIFAQVSNKNGCDFCYIHHYDFSYKLGYANTIDIAAIDDEPGIENIFWITNTANLMNNMVEYYNITAINEQNSNLADTIIKKYGYDYKGNFRKTL